MKIINRIGFCYLIVMGLILILTNSCKKEEDKGQMPVITTIDVIRITTYTATSGGDITSDGGTTVTARGVCWSIEQNPTIDDSKTTNGSGSGSFISDINGLTSGKIYHVRAFATNSVGTAYGLDRSFTTFRSDAITDIDGNYYNIITIDSQTWLEENLKTTRYRNGDLIGTTTPATLDISAEVTPKYQWAYNGSESNVAAYGRLYTWYAVTDIRNVCPTGWNVPTDAEWDLLLTILGGDDVAGGKLKETGLTHWTTPNTGATNETGFTALPGGARTDFESHTFLAIDTVGVWWNSTESDETLAPIRYMSWNNTGVYRHFRNKEEGLSVRCLRD